MRIWVVVLGTAMVGLVPVAVAQPCQPLAIEAEVARAAAIFEGQVETINPDGDHARVTFRVVQTWKAANAEIVEVWTPSGDAFEAGRSYLVFAVADAGGRLTTDHCRRTKGVELAGEELAILEGGVTPVDISDDQGPAEPSAVEEPPGCRRCGAAGATSFDVALPLLIAAALLGRRPRCARRK